MDVNWFFIGFLVIGLGAVWMALRSILRMTKRIFSCGCTAIVVFALLLVALRMLGKI